jgi:hypothetical protein
MANLITPPTGPFNDNYGLEVAIENINTALDNAVVRRTEATRIVPCGVNDNISPMVTLVGPLELLIGEADWDTCYWAVGVQSEDIYVSEDHSGYAYEGEHWTLVGSTMVADSGRMSYGS